jgi:hypothetical protein
MDEIKAAMSFASAGSEVIACGWGTSRGTTCEDGFARSPDGPLKVGVVDEAPTGAGVLGLATYVEG